MLTIAAEDLEMWDMVIRAKHVVIYFPSVPRFSTFFLKRNIYFSRMSLAPFDWTVLDTKDN